MFSIKNKVIVVTGGGGLLGSSILTRLNQAEAVTISADVCHGSKNENEVHIDITNEESVTDAVRQTVGRFGKVDGWVNNAYPRTKDWGNKLEDITFDSWRKNVDMHLNGYFLCAKLVLEQMRKQGFGSLVNMSSIYGVLAPDFSVYEGTSMTMPAAYAAIKGGITNLTRYLAAYYGPFQVRVNAVSPGGVFDNQPETFVSTYSNKVPLRRMAQPGDVAAAIHFLLSDDSAYITGHNLLVDGGWSIV